MTHDNNKENDTDIDLFRKTVGPMDPVKQDKVHHGKPRTNSIPLQRNRDDQEALANLLSDEYLTEEIQPGDVLSYGIPGLQKNILRKLRRGDYRREVELDLHGLTVEPARQALNQLLSEARREGWQCIKIVHGKGLRSSNRGPVLKSLVNTWLRHCGQVLAFCSAPPNDGGTGVVYVLLRR
ncbi:MAG: DNA mismatch repair protein MutS [Thiothrix sp.]|nr:MAG: DNA mismatch repair protein MutS [Thiothrix sp.]